MLVFFEILALSGVLYTTLFPNDECCKMIVQAGISAIVYDDNKYHTKEAWVAGRRMLSMAGIQTIYYGDRVAQTGEACPYARKLWGFAFGMALGALPYFAASCLA